MKKEYYTGTFLVFLFVASLLLVAGCSNFSGSRQGKCSEGDSCRYYSGNRGVMMYLDKPPQTFYYRTSDLGNVDGNKAEFNVRLLNDGASDSYGAVFISGFSGDMFQITRIDNQGRSPVLISKDRNACYFDLHSLGQNVGEWNFITGCFGATLNTYGTNELDLGPQFFDNLNQWFGWNLPLNSMQINVNDQGQLLNIGIGGDFGMLNYGRSLMIMASSLNLHGLGGSVFTLKGDNAASPGGDIDFKTFEVQMISPWPAGQDYYRIPYQIKSCYAYTTFVAPMICIDPDPFSDEKKVCTSAQYAYGGSQGAPVAITSVQQTNTGQEVLLEITIKNVGSGRVWDVGALEACSPYFPGGVKPTMLNVVYLGYAYIGTKPLDCGNYYQIRLDPNTQQARFTCRYDMNEADDIGSAYAVPLKMELWYGYEETISQQLTVRKLN